MQQSVTAWTPLGFGCCAVADVFAADLVSQPACTPRVCQFLAVASFFLLLCYVEIADTRVLIAQLLAVSLLAAFVIYIGMFCFALLTGVMKPADCFRRDVGACLALILLLGMAGVCFAIGAFELLEGVPLGSAEWAADFAGLEQGDPTEKLVLLILACSLVPLLWQCGAHAARRRPEAAARAGENICV